jgi:hypothetical protein
VLKACSFVGFGIDIAVGVTIHIPRSQQERFHRYLIWKFQRKIHPFSTIGVVPSDYPVHLAIDTINREIPLWTPQAYRVKDYDTKLMLGIDATHILHDQPQLLVFCEMSSDACL